ncbi:MAG: PilZ domain-containing protein [Spirochaetes bacterium]|nr:PilZ domain-containing protein [Spirochaetota bacterium]
MEKRKVPRRHLIYYLKVFDKDKNLFGHLINLSEDGLQVVTEKTYEKGQIYELFLNIPKDIAGELPNKLHFKAKVMWTKKDPNEEYFDIGLHIEEKIVFDPLLVYKLFDEIGFNS